MNLALLGGGRMGEALARGLLDAGWDPDAIAIAEIDADRRRVLEERFPGVRVVPSPAWAVADADVVVVAVKPGDVPDALERAPPILPEHALVLSIAAGVTLADARGRVPAIGRWCARCRTPPRSSARAPPRSPPARDADESHLDLAERVLGAVGIVVRVPESHARRRHRALGLGPGVRVPRSPRR